ncbi:MAG: C39 family peptidase [Methanobacterium sp.]|jgi:predicted double-glycine peptidase
MQSTDYSCGPAALATVLQNIGINSIEGDLKVLAGTDTSGTTMHELSEAAKAKGLSAAGMRLSVDDLKPNNIVHIMLDGEGHYSVVREVTDTSVYLADPSLGNIEMTREKFAEIFTGNALVITDPNVQAQETSNSTQATGTSEQVSNGTDTNLNNRNTNSVSEPVDSSATLTKDEMQNIKGMWIGPAGGILGFIVNVAWRRVTKGKYGATDVLLWMSELICGKDFDNDGWIGVPPEARRAGVNGSGYRAKSRRR